MLSKRRAALLLLESGGAAGGSELLALRWWHDRFGDLAAVTLLMWHRGTDRNDVLFSSEENNHALESMFLRIIRIRCISGLPVVYQAFFFVIAFAVPSLIFLPFASIFPCFL